MKDFAFSIGVNTEECQNSLICSAQSRGSKMQRPFEAYSGQKPYIFVSYAHRDAHSVYPEIDRWHRQGYRIWYDEGITPGKKWPVEIANAVLGCQLFVVFVTKNVIDSANVENEIGFALKKEKPLLAIYLEETELPTGLDFQIGHLQAIPKWSMNEQSYARKIEKTLPSVLCNQKQIPIEEFVIDKPETLKDEIQAERTEKESTEFLDTWREGESGVSGYRTAFTRRVGSRLHSVSVSPNGQYLGTLGNKTDRGTASHIWDLSSGRLLREIPTIGAEAVNAIVFSPDSKVVALGRRDNSVKLVDVSSGSTKLTLTSQKIINNQLIRDVVFSPDGAMIAAASTDNTVLIWDTPKGILTKTFGDLRDARNPGRKYDAVSFSSDGTLLACGRSTGGIEDGQIEIYSVNNWELVSATGAVMSPRGLAFSKNNQNLFAGFGGYPGMRWNIRRSDTRLIGQGLLDVTYDNSKDLLITSGDGIQVWARNGQNLLETLPGPRAGLSVSVSIDGSVLAAGDHEGMVWVWKRGI